MARAAEISPAGPTSSTSTSAAREKSSRTRRSGCLKDLDLVDRIIRAVRKCNASPRHREDRSGWDEPSAIPSRSRSVP